MLQFCLDLLSFKYTFRYNLLDLPWKLICLQLFENLSIKFSEGMGMHKHSFLKQSTSLNQNTLQLYNYFKSTNKYMIMYVQISLQ